MAHIKSIGMVILMQPDLEAAVAFYKQLGLRPRFHLREKWAEFEANGVKIGLCPTSRPASQLVRTGLVLEVDNVHEFYADFQGKVSFIGEPIEAVHGIMVSFQDPGGNIVDLYQPTPEKVKDLVRSTMETDGMDECCQSQEKESEGCCGGGSCGTEG